MMMRMMTVTVAIEMVNSTRLQESIECKHEAWPSGQIMSLKIARKQTNKLPKLIQSKLEQQVKVKHT